MKILLVNPPSPFLIDEKSLPFLGILAIATVIKKTSHAVDLLDLSGNKNYISDFSEYIKKNKYDVIGFTTNTPQYPYVVKLAEQTPQGHDQQPR